MRLPAPKQKLWLVLWKTPRSRVWKPASIPHAKRPKASREFYERVKNQPNLHWAIRCVEVRP